MVEYETLLHRNSRSFAYNQAKKPTDHALYKLLAIPASIMHLKTSANQIFQKKLFCCDLRRSQELSSHRLLFLFSPRRLASPLPE